MQSTHISKRLSYVLRHDPASVGVVLDEGGWVAVNELLAALARHGLAVTVQELADVVATNNKQRFTIAGGRIRANQGHSVPVDLGLSPTSPPDVLYHGTARRNLDSIMADGLRRGSRHHVHLSADTGTARQVGSRHRGPVAVLEVAAATMASDGHVFFVSANGVWLTAHVPAPYLRLT